MVWIHAKTVSEWSSSGRCIKILTIMNKESDLSESTTRPHPCESRIKYLAVGKFNDGDAGGCHALILFPDDSWVTQQPAHWAGLQVENNLLHCGNQKADRRNLPNALCAV